VVVNNAIRNAIKNAQHSGRLDKILIETIKSNQDDYQSYKKRDYSEKQYGLK
jgi:hypothetical protein